MVTKSLFAAVAFTVSPLVATCHGAADVAKPVAEQQKNNDKGKDAKADPFKDKVLVISTNLPGNTGAVLKDASYVKQGTKEFLMGTIPSNRRHKLPANWPQGGGTILIPLEQITQIALYDRIAEAVEALTPVAK